MKKPLSFITVVLFLFLLFGGAGLNKDNPGGNQVFTSETIPETLRASEVVDRMIYSTSTLIAIDEGVLDGD